MKIQTVQFYNKRLTDCNKLTIIFLKTSSYFATSRRPHNFSCISTNNGAMELSAISLCTAWNMNATVREHAWKTHEAFVLFSNKDHTIKKFHKSFTKRKFPYEVMCYSKAMQNKAVSYFAAGHRPQHAVWFFTVAFCTVAFQHSVTRLFGRHQNRRPYPIKTKANMATKCLRFLRATNDTSTIYTFLFYK